MAYILTHDIEKAWEQKHLLMTYLFNTNKVFNTMI